MKKKTHPVYKETTIVCACGNVIHTRSAKENIRVDICSNCHPFFTGQQKLIDSAGMVERFKKRYEGKVAPKKAKKKDSKKKDSDVQEADPDSEKI